MENSSFSKRNHIGFYTSWMFCAKFVLFDVFNFKGAEQLSCRFPGVERNNPNLLHVKIRPKYIPARSPKHSMNAHWIASRETRRQTPKLCARYELAKNCMELLWFQPVEELKHWWLEFITNAWRSCRSCMSMALHVVDTLKLGRCS